MRNAFIFTCAAILLLAFASPVMAENVKMKDNPKCKQWHSFNGEWTEEVEYRDSPTSAWKKGTLKYQSEWILGGSFAQIKGQDHKGASFINKYGYDAHLETHVGGGFDSHGGRWTIALGGWSGTNWSDNWTAFSPDGKVTFGRCTFEYNSDFTSQTGECQTFTDGKWWTDRKIKGTKVKQGRLTRNTS